MTATTMPQSARAADAFRYVDEVDSTNERLRAWCRAAAAAPTGADGWNAPAWAVGTSTGAEFVGRLLGTAGTPRIGMLAAGTQTAGHGRLGRTWVNRPGQSFIASFLVPLPRTLVFGPRAGWLTMAAGIAALAGVHAAGPDAALAAPVLLKWPNDVYCNGRKLGGILTEAAELPPAPSAAASGVGDDQVAFIVGIGLNLTMDAGELPTPDATALNLQFAPANPARRRALSGFDELRDRIGAGIVTSLRTELGALVHADAASADDAIDDLRRRYTAVCWTLHRPVEARLVNGGTVRGMAEDVDADAALVVAADDGSRVTVRTGDVGVLAAGDGDVRDDVRNREGNA